MCAFKLKSKVKKENALFYRLSGKIKNDYIKYKAR